MMRVKIIDKLVLKSFLGPFFLTYAVVVFILLIHTMMGYVEELVGKDVGFMVFAKMLMYFSMSLTPMALPLAVLLSCLITFGNLGEHFELTAIKSAGISLVRVLRPIGVFAAIITAVALWFSDRVVPYANLKAYSTLYNIRVTKASIDLKEGAFYNGLPGYSIKVAKKERDGKLLRKVMIYNHTANKGNKEVIIADSAYMYTILDGKYLVMELFNGRSYSDYTEEVYSNTQFLRHEFEHTKMVFSLSAFEMSEIPDSLFMYHRMMKTINELEADADSLRQEVNHLKKNIPQNMSAYFTYHLEERRPKPMDSLWSVPVRESAFLLPEGFLDSLKQRPISDFQLSIILQRAVGQARGVKQFLDMQEKLIKDKEKEVREHLIEKHRKYTYSLACFIMFLIGAPLGAIIKKGGLGVPILVSIVFFILFYALSMTGEKWAKDGVVSVFWGMWTSDFILFAFGLFFLQKARNDSRMFDKDIYIHYFRRLGQRLRNKKQENMQEA
ncbi:lipopolysaccharide export system permease protein [Thermonema lapsum]|uniref:Lipopolysaccharide export system permease protein n=1 Tax=Thermonema lapsum TaxID=28195 RepID=A0A846MQA9_9BACT|nr:LptF/LptG family permease [Thermonema lapsum]NIK73766.1 lipopolysaccharide export system permease protein [Thermonema lapsum]